MMLCQHAWWDMDSACQCGVNGNGRDAWLCLGVIGSRIQCAASIVKHRARPVEPERNFCALLTSIVFELATKLI